MCVCIYLCASDLRPLFENNLLLISFSPSVCVCARPFLFECVRELAGWRLINGRGSVAMYFLIGSRDRLYY